MTRGRCGSLALHRMTFPITAPRRFNPAHKENTMSQFLGRVFVRVLASAAGAVAICTARASDPERFRLLIFGRPECPYTSGGRNAVETVLMEPEFVRHISLDYIDISQSELHK